MLPREEKRADLMISTLRKTIVAMGGKPSLLGKLPDREPFVLPGYRRGRHRLEAHRPQARSRPGIVAESFAALEYLYVRLPRLDHLEE